MKILSISSQHEAEGQAMSWPGLALFNQSYSRRRIRDDSQEHETRDQYFVNRKLLSHI